VCHDGNPGINVDGAVLDEDAPRMRELAAWRTGSWKARVDAVIAHEFTEVLAPPGRDYHVYSLVNAEATALAITDHARRILREYREAEGF
jgi:hypothetical protein